MSFLKKRWFLVSLLVVIPGGLALGSQGGTALFDVLDFVIRPRLITAIVLFLMSFSLNSQQLQRSFRSPGPVAWAFAINFGLIPLMGWALMHTQSQADFKFGLMIAASVPCTMAAASVWTRKGGGNDAVSLLVTVSTNGLCFVITPFWLNLTTPANVDLGFTAMFWRLVIAVLIPTILGQAARLIPPAARFATRHKTPLGVVAQVLILSLVFNAACRSGQTLNGDGPQPDLLAVVHVWGSCIGIHLAAMGIAIIGAKAIGFSRPDVIAVAFAGSQKTLPIGAYLAADVAMFGNPDLLGPGVGIPFAVFPILMYHASQLFIDTVVADKFAAGTPPETDDTPQESTKGEPNRV